MPNTIEPDTSEPLFGPAWADAACADLDDAGRDLVLRAARWVAGPLADVRASTGAPMDQHCAAVVCILAGIGADAAARASALLAVLPQPAGGEEKRADKDPLLQEFGPEVLTLVRGTRTLLRLSERAWQASDNASPNADQKEMHRKMLLAMAADLRIVLMRLASRLQSLRWYASTRTECPRPFAVETMELYTPLANRLGIWQLKWEMEDLAFRFLEPDTYRAIARQLEEKRAERTAFIDAVVRRLRQALEDEKINAKVYGRPKHIYSIWNKMRVKHLEFDQLFDLRALRVIVDDERACYAALALVHSLWIPVSDEFDDYISRPKANGYRSLHTVVATGEGKPFEVQIRTREMHQFAEYGMAAHWRYKESGARGGEVAAAGGYDRKISWMRQLLAWDRGDGPVPREAPHGGAAAGPNRADDHIYVMTPQARVIELPAGSTPVDFAYHLHTDLGHRCRGARVDGQMVPLQTRLSTGQTVEIVAAKSGGPSRDWLNPQLGFLASPRSRSKVRAWFNAIELQHRISQGQTLVEKELQRLGKTSINQEQLAQRLGFARADDMYVAAAKEEFSLRQIGHTLNQDGEAPDAPGEPAVVEPGTSSVVKTGKSGVLVVGVDSLLTQFARCCRPAPPDPIVGFVTRGRGVSIHRRDCASYAAILKRYPERAIDVSWGDTNDAVYPVDIRIFAQDHSSLLHDLSDVFARLRLRVVSIQTQSRRSLSQTVFTVEVRNGEQIDRALAALNELAGVSASR
jgi:GTP pyrophosphokinase